MTDLAEWLLVQAAEDERVAQAATPGPWCEDDSWWHNDDELGALDVTTMVTAYPDRKPVAVTVPRDLNWRQDHRNHDMTHIATHDPARVLRQVEALRAVVKLHEQMHDPDSVHGPWCNGDGKRYPCPTLRALALSHADRPGYEEGWAL